MEKNLGHALPYRAEMRCLFLLFLNRDKNVVEIHKLLGRMFNCIWYRRQLEKSETPESESLARWSIEAADNDLRELMNAWCLEYGDRDLIWSLVQKSV